MDVRTLLNLCVTLREAYREYATLQYPGAGIFLTSVCVYHAILPSEYANRIYFLQFRLAPTICAQPFALS